MATRKGTLLVLHREYTMSKSLFFFAGFSLLFCVTSSLSWSMQCEEHDCDESRKTFVSTLPGSGKWKDDVTPKKNWTCQAIEDLESAYTPHGQIFIISMLHGMSI